MPKINPNQLRRKPRTTFEGVLKDSLSGIEEKREFRYLTAAEALAAQDEADAIIEKYIKKAEPLGIVDGQPVFVSTTAANMAATVAFAQTAPDGDERYTPVELLLLMASDEMIVCITNIWMQVMSNAPEPEDSKDDGLGNSEETTGNPLSLQVSGS